MDESSGPDRLVIGVISDTHGLLRSEALERLRSAQHILHAGDIGAPGIVEALRALAPVTAIRGNVDRADWAAAYPEALTLRLAGLTMHMIHDLARLDPEVVTAGVDVVISGHSHRPRVETRDGTLYLNPGSAGPRRFRLPVTVASLIVSRNRIDARIHELPV